MRWMMLLAALWLGGCNMVMTDRPLLPTSNDPQPTFRHGIWESRTDGCRPRIARRGQVPDCPFRYLINGRGTWAQNAEGELELAPLFAAQTFAFFGPDEGLSQVPFGDSNETGYLYSGFEVTERGADGAITAMTTWSVLCGPVPAPRRRRGVQAQQTYTDAPWPGLTMRGYNCTTDDFQVVRRAAELSRPLGVTRMRWSGSGR